MLKFLIFIVGIARVLSLRCHVCENVDSALCYHIEKAGNKFLKSCGKNQTKCAVMIERGVDPLMQRSCELSTWNCDDLQYNCWTCNTDGCNTGTEITIENDEGDWEELLLANIYGIAFLIFLVSILAFGCLIRMCTKKKQIEYEDDDYDDGSDEYYVNETNIDME